MVFTIFMALSCNRSSGVPAGEVPDLFHAVPSDALSVGVFGRCDNALGRMTDSTSVLRRLDYGKLSKAHSVIAVCNVGNLFPLLILEAGKQAPDTLEAAASLLALADSIGLASAHVSLEKHNAVLLSPSETVMTIALRHISSGASILDAPDFDKVTELLPGSDAVIYRNSGAPKTFDLEIAGLQRKTVTSFLKEAAEWTVVSGDDMWTVQPQLEKYYCNFIAGLEDGQSRLASVLPDDAELALDIPIAQFAKYRKAYETWRDARVELEAYKAGLASRKKAAGKSPLDWEKELDVREVALVVTPAGRYNLIRTAKASDAEGISSNPYTGFLNALYGRIFEAADSCCLNCGGWTVSGSRSALEQFVAGEEKIKEWPVKAGVVVYTPHFCLTWSNDSFKIWDSNL